MNQMSGWPVKIQGIWIIVAYPFSSIWKQLFTRMHNRNRVCSPLWARGPCSKCWPTARFRKSCLAPRKPAGSSARSHHAKCRTGRPASHMPFAHLLTCGLITTLAPVVAWVTRAHGTVAVIVMVSCCTSSSAFKVVPNVTRGCCCIHLDMVVEPWPTSQHTRAWLLDTIEN